MNNNLIPKDKLEADNQNVPLYLKVQEAILSDIRSGILKPGMLVPSSRLLAEKLGVSRKTTVKAIENLIMKGYLESKDRVGTYVRKRTSTVCPTSAVSAKRDARKDSSSTYSLTVNDGFPDTMLLPFREFSRAHRQIFNRMAQWKMLGYNDAVGYARLRSVVADVLGNLADLSIAAEEICMVRGSQMALFLVANAVLRPGDHVAIETPGYQNAYKAFQSAHLNVHTIPVDNNGFDVDNLETLCQETDIRAVYVTPRYQYPTTVTLGKARRQKLRDLSLRYHFLVIEDDFGLAYNFSGRQIPTMSAMLPKTHYIYVGTFSKIFAPGIRLGYVASSPEIIKRIASYRTLVDIQGDIITERSICDIYESGHLRKHLRHSHKIYKDRLQEASAEVKRILGDSVNYEMPHGGLALWIALKTRGITEESLLTYLHAHDTDAPVFTLADGTVGVRIGYASLPLPSLSKFLTRLKELLDKCE